MLSGRPGTGRSLSDRAFQESDSGLHPEWCIITGMNPAKQYVKNLFNLHASGVPL